MSSPRTLLVALLTFGLAACLRDEDMKLAFVTLEPVERHDGWAISTPEAEGFDREALEAIFETFHSEDAFPTARSLLVARHGKLVAEAYVRDAFGASTLQDMQSATKSVTSLLAGIALDRGLIESLDTRVYDVVPWAFDDDARKRDITLRHVLTMTTGLAFDNEVDTLPFYVCGGSSLENVLHRPLISAPGQAWRYQDGAPQLISGMIHERAGVAAEQFAREHLFAPLGIVDHRWEHHRDGVTFGAFGLWLTARDMARIGQLMLQGGLWKGEQIVPAEWVATATRPVATFEYGYLWWWWEELGAFEASGHGGQTIMVKPDADLVVVITSDPYAASGDLGAWYPRIYGWIVDALVDATAGGGT